ncbi:MAG: hypothetical protein ACFFAQ_11585 [Promethearchaeota archaeon]
MRLNLLVNEKCIENHEKIYAKNIEYVKTEGKKRKWQNLLKEKSLPKLTKEYGVGRNTIK